MRALLARGLVAAFSVGASAPGVDLRVGDPAPDFKLEASGGTSVALAAW
jgi:hypothetical protein